MSEDQTSAGPRKSGPRNTAIIIAVFSCAFLAIHWYFSDHSPAPPPTQITEKPAPQPVSSGWQAVPAQATADAPPAAPPPREQEPMPRSVVPMDVTNLWSAARTVEYWFDGTPEWLKEQSVDTGSLSNIRPKDYAGPESCQKCHPENHKGWHNHAHRRMNEIATDKTVMGDFSGSGRIDYKGGVGRFYKEDGAFRMETEKAGVKRVYNIERTIGSRFFQYYVGKLIEGPRLDEHPRETQEHVLPFGYWLDGKEWVPAVRTFRAEDADHYPFDPYGKHHFAAYDLDCGNCHTTMPAGDWMIQAPGMSRLAEYTPRDVDFHFTAYLNEVHPGSIGEDADLKSRPDSAIGEALDVFADHYPTRERSISLGISCEACHYGSAEHVAHSTETETRLKPSFFPTSPNLLLPGDKPEDVLGKTAENLNFTCAKCHSGERTEYASGHYTLNSAEYADAIRGACYQPPGSPPSDPKRQLTCVHCHNPHESIGKQWSRTPAQDDERCLSCHKQFEPETARMAHTHHPANSAGARCMNCHMPKIHEGLQNAVRTHRIFSPNEPDNLENNHPNACNLCHLDKPIDWTLTKLKEWYGFEREPAEEKIAANYPERDAPMGQGWLEGPHHATRLAAAEALIREKQAWAIPHLVDQLESDRFLINRQFTQRGLDQWLGVDTKAMGYRFFMTPEERGKSVPTIRPAILQKAAELEAAANK